MVLSDQQAACFLHQAGWPDTLIPTMVAIGHRESNLRTEAVNTDPSVADAPPTGWLQVRAFPNRTSKYNLTDPLGNAQAAKAVYDSQGLAAWAVWPSPAQADVPKIEASLHGWSSTQCGGTASTTSSSSNPLAGPLQSFLDALGTIGMVGLGIVMILLGAVILLGGSLP